MPSRAEAAKRGGVARVRNKRLPDGTLLRVTVYNSKGPRGGRTSAHKVGKSTPGKGKRNGKTK